MTDRANVSFVKKFNAKCQPISCLLVEIHYYLKCL